MINHLLSVDWNAVLCYNPSAEQTWQAFSHVLWAAVDLYVPSCTSSSNGDNKGGNAQRKPKVAQTAKMCYAKTQTME